MTVGRPLPNFSPTTLYTRVATIAEGGMGYVELCARREGRFLRWCARKRLHQQFRSDPSFRSMFMDEARLAGLVRHPNAVGVLDVGEDGDGPFLMMDFVEGVPLARLIAEATAADRLIPMQVAVRICQETSRGLQAAHEVRSEDGGLLGLVHRDVSPQNILIGFDGTVRVTDFGIAKALGNASRTSAGVLKGNMGYLSPEQLRFEETDRRSDFFSLGVTLYELLSGVRLYTNTDGFDGTRRILTEPPPDIGEIRSDVPPELCELLFELLAKDREHRPATAAEIGGRLEGILAVLIAEEGSLTIADYMNQHFVQAMQEQRVMLAEHLKAIEALPLPLLSIDAGQGTPLVTGTVASVGMGPIELPATAQARRRATGRVLLVGALAVAAGATGVVVGAWAHSRVPASTSPPAAVVLRAATPAPFAPPVHPEAPAPAMPVANTIPAEVVTVERPPLHPAAIAVHRRKAARHVVRRARNSERNGEKTAKSPGTSSHLAVPLFSEWQ